MSVVYLGTRGMIDGPISLESLDLPLTLSRREHVSRMSVEVGFVPVTSDVDMLTRAASDIMLGIRALTSFCDDDTWVGLGTSPALMMSVPPPSPRTLLHVVQTLFTSSHQRIPFD